MQEIHDKAAAYIKSGQGQEGDDFDVGYVRRERSLELVLMQDDLGTNENMVIDDELISEEQLTPLAERESDMDELSIASQLAHDSKAQKKLLLARNSKIRPQDSRKSKKRTSEFDRMNSSEEHRKVYNAT